MIKRILVVILIAFFLSISGVFCTTATAESANQASIEDDLKSEIESYVNDLDLSAFENFLSELGDDSPIGEDTLGGYVISLTKGEIDFSFESIISLILEKFKGALINLLPALITVIVIAIMSSILSGLTSGFNKKQTIDIVHFVCYSLAISVIVAKVADLIKETSNAVTLLTNLMEVSFPPLITLMTAVGGAVSSSIYKPQLAFFCTLIGRVISTVVLPLFIASVIFCVVSNLSSTIKMDKMQSAIRYASNTIVGSVFALFITYLTVAGITGGMVDGVSVKAAKFALSSYVPILGGYLSQGFDLISAGCVLIKNAIGVVGILAVVSIIIAPILRIVIFTFALKLVASLLQPLGDKRISDFLYSVSNCTKSLIIALVGVGFVFIITFLLVIITYNLGVV